MYSFPFLGGTALLPPRTAATLLVRTTRLRTPPVLALAQEASTLRVPSTAGRTSCSSGCATSMANGEAVWKTKCAPAHTCTSACQL